jgi:hypothetical protein
MKYILIALVAAFVITGCKSTPLTTPGDGPNDRHDQSASDNLRPPNAFGPR